MLCVALSLANVFPCACACWVTSSVIEDPIIPAYFSTCLKAFVQRISGSSFSLQLLCVVHAFQNDLRGRMPHSLSALSLRLFLFRSFSLVVHSRKAVGMLLFPGGVKSSPQLRQVSLVVSIEPYWSHGCQEWWLNLMPKYQSIIAFHGVSHVCLYFLDSQAHSADHSIEFIVSPKKVVGCRGGSRYVAGNSFTWK